MVDSPDSIPYSVKLKDYLDVRLGLRLVVSQLNTVRYAARAVNRVVLHKGIVWVRGFADILAGIGAGHSCRA